MRAFVLALVLGAAASFVEQSEWVAYKDTHGKSYANPIEEFYRMKVYADNKAYVEKHNAEYAQGKHTFDLALNRFADLNAKEWSATYKGLAMGNSMPHELHEVKGQVPSSIDWRQYGAVTPVKDQGQCGSCWSFSATGSLEGAWVLAGNSQVSLSEQQLVDCSGNYGNQGCNGGLMDAAFQYIRANGITGESNYAYTASDGWCQASGKPVVARLSSYHDVSSGSESALMNAVGSVGPVSVAIDASRRSFQMYNSGIYYEPSCSSSQLDHGVLAIGYGSGYWIVKNSWGSSWGQAGYINMSKDRGNNCGIATQASYPVV